MLCIVENCDKGADERRRFIMEVEYSGMVGAKKFIPSCSKLGGQSVLPTLSMVRIQN